ncbi:fasciclin domain-containing protein [Nocardioides euryhalodurans]|uniref:Fasciclin domain-containing protein n=1 Tax=Nocardioides euryhalodurans TaxID=2518370 RepID=A0A4P7GGQ1_9ACTN|nr:fasciclin domain-containing protein [Nocardioides euryhalodurans]QBR91038.1 fasciclin domain-containing protein [Nocardioides euryhalodurans]
MHKRTTAALAAAGVAALTATLLPAPASAGDHAKPAPASLAELLAADGLAFDRNWNDFDILDQAVNDVLAAKPGSPVGALADGSATLTAFAPTDRAFRRLVKDLTGSKPADEASAYAAAGTLGVDTIEQVLLYHVVLGAAVTYEQAQAADGAELTSALGPAITVEVSGKGKVYLVDQDPDNRDARVRVRQTDLTAGSQIAHGITEVLRPADL